MFVKKFLAVFLTLNFFVFATPGHSLEDIVSQIYIQTKDIVESQVNAESTDDNSIDLSEPKSPSVSPVKMTAGGYAHTIALLEDGTVWGWGNDFSGSIYAGKPMPIQRLFDVVFVAAGNFASAAIKSDGTLWMWGTGWTSNGPMSSYPLSLDKPYMTNVIDVSIGSYFTIVLKKDGSVWIWGANGSDTMEEQKIPKRVEGLPQIKSIAASWYHAAFLDVNGNVWLLKDQFIQPRVPKMVEGLSEITSITGGGHHFVALKSDGTVYTLAEAPSIQPIEGLSDVVDIAAGEFHSVAVKKDGTVWSWGELEHGLGDGINERSETPVKVETITNATGVACGNWHVIVTAEEALWAWGSNYMGQLGYGVMPENSYVLTDRSTPVKVKALEDTDSDDSTTPTESFPTRPSESTTSNRTTLRTLYY